MNNFIKKFIAIEDCFNEGTRNFIELVQCNGITWSNYELQEIALNQYYYHVRSLLLEYEPDLMFLLCSNDSEYRRVSLKLIKDGLLDLSSSDLYLEKLINISIIGNDEEKILSRNIIISRGWLLARHELVEDIISSFYKNGLDYYLYKDIGEFLYVIRNNTLLNMHVTLGIHSQDKDIVELANELKMNLVGR
ncbi:MULTISPECIES: hypothetical protein [unclassified Escherichia]|uniref:hypothetical protein n=1 Tax=unclassified Escherichia TaxID=2608889 RepID=UPI001080A07E|nr:MULTISPECIES: hypothetical protein [unclassified Escherichia]TGB93265.1 hypothetical protein CRI64_09980 [Escherichia sp. E2748]TGC28979.1 hypothetical protein CQJ27_02005 [Escherichia sp. E1130]TLI63371.1 hypothetical protein FEK66_22685 [Escherichia sp. E1130]TLI78647.1 hypothetical protein FEK42_22360 [Escherichia sp. E2748]